MNVLVTGSNGFIGKNLCVRLRERGDVNLLTYDRGSPPDTLWHAAGVCDFVFHLAGVNRPADDAQFAENHRLTARLTDCLARCSNPAPVLYASSTQALLDTPYGKSKREAERLLLRHAEKQGAKALLYRLCGAFGKWSRPHYNSVVATFCDAAANGRPLPVDDPDASLTLAYIDDITKTFVHALTAHTALGSGLYAVTPTHTLTVGRLAQHLTGFAALRGTHELPDLRDAFVKKLYSTYLTFLPPDRLVCPLDAHRDGRGFFAEFLRLCGGQLSVNRVAPGAVKGGHYHHTKVERFLAVSGTGKLVCTPLFDAAPFEHPLDGQTLRAVDIPPGVAHTVQNTGDTDLLLLLWANEWFDPHEPDTFRLASILEGGAS